MVDAIDPTIVRDLAGLEAALETADGDGKTGIAPRSALANQTRVQQHDLPIGMQLGQAAGAGETGHTGPDHRPGDPMSPT